MEIADREIFLRYGKGALRDKLGIEEGDLHFVRARISGTSRAKYSDACGCASPKFRSSPKNSEHLDFLWVTDFPLLQWSAEENKWNAVHHPFTRPKAEDVPLLDARKFGEVRAEAYDVVLNGVEIGGGSIRIHEPELQAKMFESWE